MADTQNPTTTESPLDHMEQELRELEGEGKSKWWKWLFIVGIAIVAVLAYTWTGKQSTTPPPAGPQEGVAIDMPQPAAGKLSAAPTRFEWESVAGRYQYRLTVTRAEEKTPLIDKTVKDSHLDLAIDEVGKLKKGATYVWRVEALDKGGRKLGSGQSHFAL